MLSRVADSLYWTSRYLERAEHTARLVDINMGLMLDRSRVSTERRWQRVLDALGSSQTLAWSSDSAAGSGEPGPWMSVTALVHALCFDTTRHASITACVFAARENARQIRDEISTEQWQRLNGLFHEISRLRTAAPSMRNLTEFLPTIIDGVHLFQGVTDTTLSHGEGWLFLQVGQYLERAWSITTLLDLYEREVFLGEDTTETSEYLEWIGLLRICTAFEAFCRVHTSELTHERILDFLLLNPQFPHSVRYAVNTLVQALEAIQQQTRTQRGGELMRVAGRLKAMLGFARVAEILARDPVRYLREILDQCREIHDLIYAVYIQYSVETALTA
ncbi:MAG TPA: alpha-E domain-containing protein [Acidobacteriaceae bacterium]|nr:alpha-E domain-containing protein [Acidobacteriaceae bacterium]